MDKQLLLWPREQLDDGVETVTPPQDETMSAAEATSEAFDATAQPTPELPHLITSGVIAAEVKQPLHRIRWILKTRPDIRPVAYVGITRLFTQSAIARVRYELNAIDARRATQGGDSQCP